MDSAEAVTVSEFRKNTKVILDNARDTPIYVKRGEELFQIVKVGNMSIQNVVPRYTEVIKRVTDTPTDTPLPELLQSVNGSSEPATMNKVERTPQIVRNEAMALKGEISRLKKANEANQDPDFWVGVQEKENKEQELWDEYWALKGK